MSQMSLRSFQLSSLFDTLAAHSEGIVVINEAAEIVWISDTYLRILPSLSVSGPSEIIGQKVQETIPNTRLNEVLESGEPVMMDLMVSSAGTFLVSRIPLRNAEGRITGAMGVVWLTDSFGSLRPLMSKFIEINRKLGAARRAPAHPARRVQYTLADYLGSSPAVQEMKHKVLRCAKSSSAVLLLGETGVGKELIAQALHDASPRREGPFVAINVAAIPEALLEAELFGVAPGAYTGADKHGRTGKIEIANQGTLFLDEIGDMPLATQVKLLRVLQERVLEPLGSNKLVPVDVRLVSATSVNLEEKIRSGGFRADLFYRLSALPVRLPALYERAEDIPLIADRIVRSICEENQLPPKRLSPEVLRELQRRRWPGNFRQIRNMLEYAVVMSDGDTILMQHIDWNDDAVLFAREGAAAGFTPDATPDVNLTLAEQVRALERAAIQAALEATGGDKVRAAQRLGISRASLYQKLRS